MGGYPFNVPRVKQRLRPPTRKRLVDGKWRSRAQLQAEVEELIAPAREYGELLDEGREAEADDVTRRAFHKLERLMKHVRATRD